MASKKILDVPQFNQKTPYSCIPACLQQVFEYYGEKISQEEIMKISKNPKKGMAIVEVALFAIKHGFDPLIITNNIYIFDPTWFSLNNKKIINNLKKRERFVDRYNRFLINKYLEYLYSGGRIKFDTISETLFKKYLSKNIPIIVELASTFLYKKAKSNKPGSFNDPFRGKIEGHGVVLAGFDKGNKFMIVDPNSKKSPSPSGIYWADGKELMMSLALLDGKSVLLIKTGYWAKKNKGY